jgi:archaemetzincin
MHRRSLLLGALGAASWGVGLGPVAWAGEGVPAVANAARGTVLLVPLRSFPGDLLDAIESLLIARLQVRVERGEPMPLPQAAYHPPRRRYRADKLLDHLLAALPDERDDVRALGLTTVDISTTKGGFADWGVFGLGFMPGRACVISSHRLRRGARDRQHLAFRVSTTALHEVGHTFGLDHCNEPRCPMQDAEGGIENTDASLAELGPRCRARLDAMHPLRR